jgi:hypothetical protein
MKFNIWPNTQDRQPLAANFHVLCDEGGFISIHQIETPEEVEERLRSDMPVYGIVRGLGEVASNVLLKSEPDEV